MTMKFKNETAQEWVDWITNALENKWTDELKPPVARHTFQAMLEMAQHIVELETREETHSRWDDKI